MSLETADLFGSPLPEGYDPSERLPSKGVRTRSHTASDEIASVMRHGTVERGAGKPEKRKIPNFCPKAEKIWTARGYQFRRVDPMVSWSMKTLDWLGLFDAEAEKAGMRKVWIQVCAKSARSPHLRKMTDDSLPVHRQAGGNGKRTRLSYLRERLAMGDRVVLMQFSQPRGRGTRWECEEEEVTAELVAAFCSRKKGQKTRVGKKC